MNRCLKFYWSYCRLFIMGLCSLFYVSCIPKEISLGKDFLKSLEDGQKVSVFAGLTSAQTLSDSKIQLNWTAAQDPTVIAYNVYDTTLIFKPVLVKTVRAPASSTSITSLKPMTYYSFRVRAVKNTEEEDTNVVDKGAIPYGGVISSEVLTSTTAKLTFSQGGNADSVRVYCKVGLGAVFETLLAEIPSTLATTTILTGLTPGQQYVCRVALNIGGFEDNNTVTTSFIPLGQAARLVYTTQPSSSAAGVVLSVQPVISIQDSNGNVITAGPDSNASIALTVSSSSPSLGTVRGTATVNAVKGVATFAGLNFQETGTKILTATKSDTTGQINGSGALTSDSSSFVISPGPVSILKSTISISPAVPPSVALVADGNNAYQVSIKLADQYDNPVAGVKPQFASSITGDILSQPTQSTNSDGISIGSIGTVIADEIAPFRTLSISSPAGLSTITTFAPFLPGPATKLGFVLQPSNSPAGIGGIATVKVAIQDANGNIVNTGANSSAIIALNIASNVNSATLSGTTSAQAINGIATFSDLGIDKTAAGYKLLASSGSYIPAYSNAFNVMAGIPQKISISGANSVISGSCSTPITVQLQDNGNNPANAVQNTPLAISGLSGASLYSSSACSGTALSSTLTFTAGTNIKTVYLKDAVGEAVALSIRDSSNVLTTGTRTINVLPDKIGLVANMPSPPAAAGTAMSVVAGVCSPPIYITPAGDNGNAAPLFSITPVAVTGLTGSGAILYSDASCTQSITASNISLPVTSGTGNNRIAIYLKDDKAESLNMSVTDPSAIMNTVSGPQFVNVLPSNIEFTGPTSVVAGKCSAAFTITLRDKAGNAVLASAPTSLKINGLGGSTTAKFYTSASCSGSSFNSTVVIPQNFSAVTLFFSDTTAEALNVYISDPAALMANSASISIGISPAGLKITGPLPANSKTTVCAGPFTVNTMDGAVVPNVTAAISAINVKLAHSGYATGFDTAGVFYGDSGCTNPITSLTFSAGVSAQNFYFMGQYPITTLTITASDLATVLTSGSTAWTVIAAKSWIGTMGSDLVDSLGNLLSWFKTGVQPVAARMDAPSSAKYLRFDSQKKFLYVVDENSHRVLKYDYINRRYVGWIGGFTNPNNAAAFIRGSTQNFYTSVPSPAQCIATTNGQTTPGWCLGGQSYASVTATTGVMYGPRSLAVDDGLNYIYVANYNSHSITRYVADSGAFAGWIGGISSAPSGPATGGPGTCSTTSSGGTPGWCMGGGNTGNPSGTTAWQKADGSFYYPRAVVADGTYLYVSTPGAVLRYLESNGSFQGWIGKMASAPNTVITPTGGAAGCTTLSSGTTTPGWCMGGTFQATIPTAKSGTGNLAGGINHPTDLYIKNGLLYVAHTDSGGTISTYNLTTGSFVQILPSLTFNWQSPMAMIEVPNYQSPGTTNFAIADSGRVITVDPISGLVLGWLGKVANNIGLSPSLGNTIDCSNLAVNANTPGWCLGGSAKAGMDEQALEEAQAIEYDGNGNILVGQWRNPSIKIFNAATGAYGGSFVYTSSNLNSWSADSTTDAEYYGFGDGDFFNPRGVFADSTYLYVADGDNGRIKKVSLASGATIGTVGAVTTVPTGGPSANASACLSTNPMSVTSGWCLGAMPNLWSTINFITNVGNLAGSLNVPHGIVGDGTYLYVVDIGTHRIHKYNASTGAYVGWIGAVSQTPTGGAAGCNSAQVGTFTPGWCTGGYSQAGNGNGMLTYPSGITYIASTGYLYVIDNNNHRVVSYDANTGAFKGWIGRTNIAPSSSCTTASNGSYTVSVNGWCLGGTSQAGLQGGDRGGGFYFWVNGQPGGITTDGTNLYIANFYNSRIDKYSTAGVFLGSVNPRWDTYTNTWVAAPTPPAYGSAAIASIGGYYTMGIYADATNMYVLDYYSTGAGSVGPVVVKLNLTTGTVVGWQGAILPSNLPVGGESGCAGATVRTPGWCQGGQPMQGFRLGQLSSAYYLTGDANYIYISDVNTHRVNRIPK